MMDLAGTKYSVCIEDVEREMRSILYEADSLVHEYIALVAQGVGKRLRPQLLIMFADLFGTPKPGNVTVSAACCELLHTVSLIHDDVIDSAETRRGLATLNSQFGNEAAVIVGDYILAQSFLRLAQLRDFTILELTINASKKLGLGVIEEIRARDKLSLAAQKYFEMIGLKTGALFALVCEGGAYLGGADDTGMASAREFGRNLGLAFQVVDDLLDLTQSSSDAGKPTFSDLREGRITLPVIYAYEANAEKTEALISRYHEAYGEEQSQAIRDWLIETSALRRSLEDASGLLSCARNELERATSLGAHPEKASGILELTNQVLARVPSWARESS